MYNFKIKGSIMNLNKILKLKANDNFYIKKKGELSCHEFNFDLLVFYFSQITKLNYFL